MWGFEKHFRNQAYKYYNTRERVLKLERKVLSSNKRAGQISFKEHIEEKDHEDDPGHDRKTILEDENFLDEVFFLDGVL